MSSIGDELPLASTGDRPDFVIDPYRLLSIPATIRHEDERLLEALRWHLAPFAVPQRQRDSYDLQIVQTRDDDEEAPWRLTYVRGGERLFRGAPYRVLDYALWDAHSLPHRFGRDFVFLHAAVAELGGRRVVLPAEPGAGKSTLVASLLRHGFGYLSDELAPIDPVTSRVYPYPKHIGISKQGLAHLDGGPPGVPTDYPALSEELTDRHLRAEDLGARTSGAGSVDLVVFLEGEREHEPRLRPVPPAEAVARLLGHTLNVDVYGNRAVRLLARVVDGADVYELSGGSSARRAAALVSLLSA